MGLTGTQLIARVRLVADLQGNTARHSDADILLLINQSIAGYRRIVANEDAANYATRSVYSAVADTPTVALAATDQVLSVAIEVDGLLTLLHRASVGDYASYSESGVPAGWRLEDGGAGAVHLRLTPTPDTAYPITVEYLPTHTDVTTATSWHPQFSGGEDWVVYDVATKLAIRDAHPRAPLLAAERDRQERLLTRAAQRGREGVRRRDTRGEERKARWRSRR